jgi:hypothetical protein
MSSCKTAIALGLAGVVALSTVTPSMATMPTPVAAIKGARSTGTIDVRWSWCAGIGVGIGSLLGATIAAPHYYGHGYYYAYGYPYGYAGYYYSYPYAYGYYRYPNGGARPYWGWRG